MFRHWRSVLVILAICCMLFAPAFAETAKVAGTVRTTDYEPLAGYTVTLQNTATGSVLGPLTTGADGKYSFGFVQPGNYVLIVAKDGKEVNRSEELAVEVGAAVQQNAELELAPIAPPQPTVVAQDTTPAPPANPPAATTPSAPTGTTTTATTTPANTPAPAPAQPTTTVAQNTPKVFRPVTERPAGRVVARQTVRNDLNTSIGAAVSREQLQSLPLYNRNFLVLGLLTPNTHEVESSSTLQGGSFTVAGVRAASNSFLLDGVDNVATSSGQAIPFQVNEAIREFRVTSANANAEYGRNSGAVVDIVTNRAGNKWHGAGFGYFGADELNASAKTSIYSGTTFDRAAAYAGPTGTITPSKFTNPNGPGGVPITWYTPHSYNEYVASTSSINTALGTSYCTNPLAAPGSATCNQKFNPSAMTGKDNKAPFNSKQFGYNMGGPIKKIFVYGSYEGTRISNPNAIFERVPSLYDRGENASYWSTLGTAGTLTAMPQAQLFVPGAFGTIPGVAPSYSVAQKILGLYPKPNRFGVPGALEFYEGLAPNYTNADNALLRADWTMGGAGKGGFSQRHDITLRYAAQKLNQLHDSTLPEQANYEGNGAIRDAINQSASFAVTSMLSPALSNDFRVGANRFQVFEKAQDEFFDPAHVGISGGSMPAVFLAGLDPQYAGMNCIKDTSTTPPSYSCLAGAMMSWQDLQSANGRMLPTLDGQFPMARLGAPLTAPSRRRDSGFFLNNQMAFTHGRHEWKFGGEYRLYQNQYTNGGLSRGYINSGNIGAFAADTEACFFGCSMSAAFLYPSFDYRIKQPSEYRGLLKSYSASGFLQDTWHATDRLTFNLGVRYEFFSVPNEMHDQLWNYDPVANGLIRVGSTNRTPLDPYGSACPVSGVVPNFMVPSQWTNQNLGWKCQTAQSTELYPSNKRDFAPRAGFAWSMDKSNRTVLRGAIGFYFDQQPAGNLQQMLMNRPNYFNTADPSLLYGAFYNPSICSSTGYCGGIGNNTLSSNANIIPAFQSGAMPNAIYAKDVKNSHTPYTRQISGSLQRLMTNNLGVELGYIGTQGYRLPVVTNSNFSNEWFCTNPTGTTNPCDPFSFSPIFTQTNQGSSEYHSLMARMRGNWSKLSINATYTWSKSMDNVAATGYPTLPATAMGNLFGLQLLATGIPNSILPFRQGFPYIQGSGALTVPTVLPDFSVSALTTTGMGRIFTTPYNISQNPLNWAHDDWGRSDFDAAHRLVVDYTYKFGKKDSILLSDWQISSIVVAQSGQPYTVFSQMFGELTQRAITDKFVQSKDPDHWISAATSNQYLPSLTSQCSSASLFGTTLPTGGYVNGTPFSGKPGSACMGNAPRNAFTGPVYFNNDLAVQKQIKFKNSESRFVTVRSEFYNLFNRANYYNPNSILSYDGQTMNPEFGKIKSSRSPFQMQLGVRFVF